MSAGFPQNHTARRLVPSSLCCLMLLKGRPRTSRLDLPSPPMRLSRWPPRPVARRTARGFMRATRPAECQQGAKMPVFRARKSINLRCFC